ncbi:MAG: hypothetical protein EZS28_001921 [Streblomastix strix]|uniref:Uncharacterized protein n=1 Tax=Streblomastix strix TaxID=222440 RepID=A0A5J4X6A2_9EUKA|nr:MAG: hypothetical protein EZS28_001921 [Streblomastix strix]
MGSHFRGKKTKHLAHDSHAVISKYKDSTGDCFTIEAEIVVQNEKQFLLATWKPFLAAQGFKGAEDPGRTVLQVNTKKAEYVNVKDFYAGLRKK